MKTLKNMIDEAFDPMTIKNLENWMTTRSQQQNQQTQQNQKNTEEDKKYFDILSKEIALQKAEMFKKTQPVQNVQPTKPAQISSNSASTAQVPSN